MGLAVARLGVPSASVAGQAAPKAMQAFHRRVKKNIASPNPPADNHFVGGCSAYNAFKEISPHPDPKDDNNGSATKAIDSFFDMEAEQNPDPPATVRYVIALTPDPRHTNLSVVFDR